IIRMRNGLVMPMITIGGENRSVMAESEPKNINEKDELRFAMSDASHLTMGDATKGSTRRKAQAARRSFRRMSSRGFRSASFPPTTYPADRAIMIMPMIFVQTKVEVPKKGAMSRDAQSSTAMMHMPEKKAST